MRILNLRGASLAAAVPALLMLPAAAEAGGYAVREQSASLLGSAFAGAAAGVDLSSAFWNPAAFGIAQDGLSSENHYSLIVADTELSNGVSLIGPPGADTSTDIDKLGYLSSGYFAYRLNDKLVLGVSTGAPFGLKTEPDNENWAGAYYGRGADLLTYNVTPTLAYEIAPGVHVAAGLQLQHMRLKLWTGNPLQIGTATTSPTNLKVNIDDSVGVGFTAGILLQPTAQTSIGLGFRSSIEQELEGKAYLGPIGLVSSNVKAELETPEILTLSISQEVMRGTRLLGTVEWTNWSRFGVVPVTGLLGPAAVVGNWDDGWFYSVGAEYDYSETITLRGGVAYEQSPIQNAEQRLLPLPDSDRVWLSVGASYRYSESTTLDFGHSHIFFEDAELDRHLLTDVNAVAPSFTADVENSANIFSVGMKTKW